MNIALVYRGFYKRAGKKSNSFNADILKNHLDSVNSLNVKNIDIYFHTYSISKEDDDELISIFKNYNLKKYVIEKKIQKKITYSILKSLKLVKDNYDLIINTRFDIIFMKSLNEFNIVKKKINLCFKDLKSIWKRNKKVSDLLFVIRPKYKKILMNALEKSQNLRPRGPGHFIYKYLKTPKDKINFMIDGFFSSNTDIDENNYFYIKRD